MSDSAINEMFYIDFRFITITLQKFNLSRIVKSITVCHTVSNSLSTHKTYPLSITTNGTL